MTGIYRTLRLPQKILHAVSAWQAKKVHQRSGLVTESPGFYPTAHFVPRKI